MDADKILETIDRFWEARVAGDKETLRSFLSADATYEMVGAKAFADQMVVGPSAMAPAADQLVDAFKFHSLEKFPAIVDGLRVAMPIKVEVSFRTGTPVTTEACDLWEFDAAGKATSLRQFVDTDLVRKMMDGRV